MVLVEHAKEDGGVVQIVYRNGGHVDAGALEMLCDKVHKAQAFCSANVNSRRQAKAGADFVETCRSAGLGVL